VSTLLAIGQQNVTFGAPSYIPTPDVISGRLANLQNAWVILDNVTYPLIDESRNVFFASYKYEPLQGLPRFVIVQNDLDLTTLRIYPAPSQAFELFVFGKFELSQVTSNDTMALFPAYYQRFLKFALAKDLALYKGRESAWTEKLEAMYMDAKKDMESVSSVNLTIQTDDESYLNGAHRVRAGI
jgi:hypothetical protein